MGNRVEKSLDADGDGSGTAAVAKFGHDPYGNAWADLNSSGSLTTRRFYEDALDTVFARMASSGDEDWYAKDNKGSVYDILDHTGALIDNIEYSTFGKVLAESNPTNGDAYQYAGFEVDKDIGLARNGARWYSFDIGGWWSEDPIGFAGGSWNLSAYVGNNSVNSTDPSGLQERPRPAIGPVDRTVRPTRDVRPSPPPPVSSSRPVPVPDPANPDPRRLSPHGWRHQPVVPPSDIFTRLMGGVRMIAGAAEMGIGALTYNIGGDSCLRMGMISIVPVTTRCIRVDISNRLRQRSRRGR